MDHQDLRLRDGWRGAETARRMRSCARCAFDRECEVCAWFSVLPRPSSLAHERAREYIFNGGRTDRTLVDVLGDALELRRTSPWSATLVGD